MENAVENSPKKVAFMELSQEERTAYLADAQKACASDDSEALYAVSRRCLLSAGTARVVRVAYGEEGIERFKKEYGVEFEGE